MISPASATSPWIWPATKRPWPSSAPAPRKAAAFKVDYNDVLTLEGSTEFTGYDSLSGEGVVTAILRDGEAVDSLAADESGVVVLDSTPFYGESGGQVGDSGYLERRGCAWRSAIPPRSGPAPAPCKSAAGYGQQGRYAAGRGGCRLRQRTRLNHSATHLLHAALREVLGDHVQQKGSLVDSERLRFDFSHFEGVTPEQLQDIENMVNEQIRANTQVQTRVMSMDDAVAAGAMALFGEKYGDEVRVLSMGEDDFSVELCGGTHVSAPAISACCASSPNPAWPRACAVSRVSPGAVPWRWWTRRSSAGCSVRCGQGHAR